MRKTSQITILLICFVSFTILSLCGQTTTKGLSKEFNVWVTKIDNSPQTKGFLYAVNDSTVIVTNSTNTESKTVNVNMIDEIKLRRKGKAGAGAVYGILIGFTVGATIGILSGDDDPNGFISFTKENKAVIFGTLMSLPGAIIGVIVGSAMNVRIPINGNQKTYDKQKEKLKRYQLSF